MSRGIFALLWLVVALAQTPAREPLDAAIQAYENAHQHGSFSEAAAKREEARNLLQRAPVDAPQFGNWVQQVAQFYENAGMSVQARATIQDALSRTDALGQSHPTRIMLLSTLANSWQQDRNLLKSLTYSEKAAAAADAAPPATTSSPGAESQTIVVLGRHPRSFTRTGSVQNNAYVYQQLAETYRQLGRPDAAAAVFVKLRALAKNDDSALASLYEQQGKFDEVAALFRKQADQAAANLQSEPWQVAGPFQALANLYQREERYSDAVAVVQQAISALDASGKSEAQSQAISLRQNLAGILNQAGQTQAADQVYQQLLADTQSGQHGSYAQVLMNYANHLGSTNRGAQAESLLSDYLTNHSNLEPWEETNLLYALSNLARMSGKPERADEYQQAAIRKQQALQSGSLEQVSIGELLQKAESAATGENFLEGFALALQAMDAAPGAVDRDQVAWTVPSIATTLAGKKAADKSDQIYTRLFGLLQSWSVDNQQPLLSVLESYPRFLLQQPERWVEAPAAIERYGDALIAARGAGTGWLGQALHLTIEFEQFHGSRERAVRAGQDLLALVESLSGTTSEPYLEAVQTLAGLYDSTDDPGRALPLHRQAVAIADLIFPPGDTQPGHIRANAALAFANQRQFDEAERLANEAVAIGQHGRPPQPQLFIPQLEQVLKMKAAP